MLAEEGSHEAPETRSCEFRLEFFIAGRSNAESDLRQVVAHWLRATLFGRLGGEGYGGGPQFNRGHFGELLKHRILHGS